MPKENIPHKVVIECLTTALLQLMEKKPFAQISISELCQRAGVSRVSFYRNFSSMEVILLRYLKLRSDEAWDQELAGLSVEERNAAFWPWLMQLYRKEGPLLLQLQANHLEYLLKDHIFACCGPTAEHSPEEAYSRAILAGGIYGYVDEWIRRGMEDAPEDLRISKIWEHINP